MLLESTRPIQMPQPLAVGDSPTHVGMTLSGLTSSRLLSSDGTKKLSSVDLTSFLSGTSNQITVTDEGDGKATLSLPSSIVAPGSINAGTTIAGGKLTLTESSGNVQFEQRRNVDGDARWLHQINPLGEYSLISIKPAATGSIVTNIIYDSKANLRIGGGLAGTSSERVLSVKTGVSPLSTPADTIQIFSADYAGAGTTALHARNEQGHVIKLYRQAHISDADGTLADVTSKLNSLLSYMENLGFTATS